MAYYAQAGLCEIAISPHQGFRNRDLEFLQEYPGVRGVSLSDASKVDITGLRFLEGSLRKLIVADNHEPLDLARFRRLEEFRGEWHPRLGITPQCSRLRILDLSKYIPQSKDLTQLALLPALQVLSLVESPLVSLRGIGRFTGLLRLELAYLTRLESIEGLAELSTAPLETLDCQNCKRIRDHEAVAKVLALRVVKFNRCGEIPTIRFLNDMPNIEEFRFVHTNVLDGDLHPLLRLKSVGFFKQKHYSHTPEEVEAVILSRGT